MLSPKARPSNAYDSEWEFHSPILGMKIDGVRHQFVMRRRVNGRWEYRPMDDGEHAHWVDTYWSIR